MRYKCRTTKPAESKWYEIEAASPEQAANDYHTRDLHCLASASWEMKNDDGGKYYIMFALVEVEGHGEWVSRVYKYGIYRKGGVKRPDYRTHEQKLKDLATAIGWEKDPAILIEDGWEGEETLEEASARG